MSPRPQGTEKALAKAKNRCAVLMMSEDRARCGPENTTAFVGKYHGCLVSPSVILTAGHNASKAGHRVGSRMVLFYRGRFWKERVVQKVSRARTYDTIDDLAKLDPEAYEKPDISQVSDLAVLHVNPPLKLRGAVDFPTVDFENVVDAGDEVDIEFFDLSIGEHVEVERGKGLVYEGELTEEQMEPLFETGLKVAGADDQEAIIGLIRSVPSAANPLQLGFLVEEAQRRTRLGFPHFFATESMRTDASIEYDRPHGTSGAPVFRTGTSAIVGITSQMANMPQMEFRIPGNFLEVFARTAELDAESNKGRSDLADWYAEAIKPPKKKGFGN